MSKDSLDTNLIVHFILGDQPGQRQAVLKLLNTPGVIHCIEDMALSEIAYVLEEVYEQKREEIVGALKGFFEQYGDCLNYNKKLLDRVWPIYSVHPKLSFVDCCLAVYAEMKNAEPLLTFDRKLANQVIGAKRLV